MARRASTGKRLRFEVFKRDGFTCQYCGARPPDVLLVVDHVDPRSRGGTSEVDNLITACEPCNQGKADTVLGDVRPRPDADLLYLETQQEIGELRRYTRSLAERDRALAEVVEMLQARWCETAGLDWSPADAIIRQLLDRYGPEITGAALDDVAPKIRTGYLKTYNRKWVGYLYRVAATFALEDEDEVR